jgi:superoxide dismutase, Cu-Zn family
MAIVHPHQLQPDVKEKTMNKLLKITTPLIACAALAMGCDTTGRQDGTARHDRHDGQTLQSERNQNRDQAREGDRNQKQQGPVARAKVEPSKAARDDQNVPDVTGTVTFRQVGDQEVRVMVDLRGLPANSEHGFHIHEKGDLTAPDFTSAGPHYNPGGGKHGGLHTDTRHAGDLGNIKSDAQGRVKTELTAHGVSVDGENSIVGRSILVHAKADDLKTDPSGESGDRIAGGRIERGEKQQEALRQRNQTKRAASCGMPLVFFSTTEGQQRDAIIIAVAPPRGAAYAAGTSPPGD